MPSYHVSIKSAKPGAALEHFEYITRVGLVCPGKADELVWWESRNMPVWASNPKEFFDGADKHERVNGAAYRELEISLPKELPREKNIELAQSIAERLLGARPCVLAIHEKLASISGEPHPHVHAMYSDRACDGIPRSKETFFARHNAKQPAKGGARKLSGGSTPSEIFEQAREIRKRIADSINEALSSHGVQERVDSRSLEERGIKRRAEKPLGARARGLTAQDRKAVLVARAQPNGPSHAEHQ